MQHAKDWPYAVVFDLDGTLIDSAPDIAYALNETVANRGLRGFALEEVKGMIGGGVPKLLERALAARGDSAAHLPEAVSAFIEIYRNNLTVRTTLYDGARELLENLCEEGRLLGLCTNKPHELTVEVLKQLNIAKFFSAVSGGGSETPKKPDPASLLEVLAHLEVKPKDAVMVGDSAADVGCARGAGVPVVLVSFGYSRAAPQFLGAGAVMEKLADVPGCFKSIYGLSRKATSGAGHEV